MEYLDAEACINYFIETNADFYAFKENMEFALEAVDKLPLSEEHKKEISKAFLYHARYYDMRGRLFYHFGKAHMVKLLATTDSLQILLPED